MLYWIHPLWQAGATVFALGALVHGWRRFRMLHLGRRGAFVWKRHVFLGSVALTAWVFGAVLGLVAARLDWGVFFLTGPHAWTGAVFVGLAAVGYLTGHILDRSRKRRIVLPLVHGGCNTALVVLVFVQAWTGWEYLV